MEGAVLKQADIISDRSEKANTVQQSSLLEKKVMQCCKILRILLIEMFNAFQQFSLANSNQASDTVHISYLAMECTLSPFMSAVHLLTRDPFLSRSVRKGMGW